MILGTHAETVDVEFRLIFCVCVSRLSTKQPFLWLIFSAPPFQTELTFMVEIFLYLVKLLSMN